MCLFPTKSGYPCGKCIDCLSKKRNDWSLRLQYEYDYWFSLGRSTWMALLTYDELHVPRTSKGNLSLRQRDVQLFLKRLRKRLNCDHIFVRYFYCGEYGPSTKRPHYHLLIFGLPSEWKYRKVFDLLQDCWPNGCIGKKLGKTKGHKGPHYATKYMINKILKLDDPEQEKPFTRMSKGLGISFIMDVVQDDHGLRKVGFKDKTLSRFNGTKVENVDLSELYDSLFPIVKLSNGYDRSSIPQVFDDQEAIEIANLIVHYLHDRVPVDINGQTIRCKLPRYYRDRVFDKFERDLLNFANQVLFVTPLLKEYQEKYGEYDSTHDIPMKLLQAMEKQNRLISNYIKESKSKDRL